jgi:hypothetical protein
MIFSSVYFDKQFTVVTVSYITYYCEAWVKIVKALMKKYIIHNFPHTLARHVFNSSIVPNVWRPVI